MVPKHIALIMDGNGRWAKSKGKPRTFGHKQGSETLKQICKDAYDLGIKYVTVYAFSTENWRRSKEEVSFLMGLLRQYLKESIRNSQENNMRVRVIGRRSDLDDDIVQAIEALEDASKDFDGLQLQIALNYGGRDEILRGVHGVFQHLIDADATQEVSKKDLLLAMQELDEDKFAYYLDTVGIPDPELLIRTSGELRTSNFLLWQLAYTEFYISDVLWPDFNKAELIKAIDAYNRRERRFGGAKK